MISVASFHAKPPSNRLSATMVTMSSSEPMVSGPVGSHNRGVGGRSPRDDKARQKRGGAGGDEKRSEAAVDRGDELIEPANPEVTKIE